MFDGFDNSRSHFNQLRLTCEAIVKHKRTAPLASPSELSSAVNLMRTRIKLLARPKPMRSIIDATQREQPHGSA